jgi:transcriptional regulator with XRE-family HTH domain
MNYKTIGERLKYIRVKNDKTQDELGGMLFLSRDHISRLERNKCNPTESTIELFCKLFGVNKNWILTGTGDVFNNAENKIEYNEELKEVVDKLVNLPQDDYNKAMKIIKMLLSE